ncbi:MAG TPA: flagellar biosynthetic protein FliR [Candidatus Kapabacteria bacterium]|nr:flagellar biosynthetic protein FliR [Candidatus Kapabacteria bacterium]
MNPDAGTISILYTKFMIGILIFVRISGMFLTAPFFKSIAIMPQIKVFLAALIAVSMTDAYWQSQPTFDFHLWSLVFYVFKEFTVGAIIGFSANMVFHSARMAGGLIDFEMGFQAASVFDPASNNPTLIGELKDLIALMMFLIINGHHQLIEVVYASIRAVPLTTFAFSEPTYLLLIKYITTVFILAIKIAAPVLIALFSTNLALALLARVAPQTNIFIVSFQLKVAVGLLMLFVSVPLLVYVIKWALGSMQEQSMQMIMTLYPPRV